MVGGEVTTRVDEWLGGWNGDGWLRGQVTVRANGRVAAWMNGERIHR